MENNSTGSQMDELGRRSIHLRRGGELRVLPLQENVGKDTDEESG
jgi:hypothetical protein